MSVPASEENADKLARLLEALRGNGASIIVQLGEMGDSIKLERIVDATGEYIVAHPYHSAFHAATAITFLFPGLAAGQLLGQLGFGATGPISGPIAAKVHGVIGIARARSVFSLLQSASMGGYGAPVVNGVVRAASLGSSALSAVWARGGSKEGAGKNRSKIQARL